MRVSLFNLFFYAYTVYIAAKVALLAQFRDRHGLYPTLKAWGDTTVRALDVILGAKVEVRGLENVPEFTPERPVLLVSKHQSELDVVMLAVLFPYTGAVAMKELENYPFFGTIMKTLQIVMVAIESGPQNRTEQTIEGAAATFAQSRPMMIYPEGELMKLGAKERYRRGAAHIYTRLNPVTIPVVASLGVVWPRREWGKNPGTTGAIEFLEPMPEGLSFEAFQEEVERRIEEGTMRLIREHAPAAMLAEAEDRKARGVNNHNEVPKASREEPTEQTPAA
ncbi:MAG: lysophospholipid acyltransferase family protein [Pseudomonadota bacterium]